VNVLGGDEDNSVDGMNERPLGKRVRRPKERYEDYQAPLPPQPQKMVSTRWGVVNPKALRVGDEVAAFFKGRKLLYRGTITAVNDNETFAISYVDGDFETHVDPTAIRQPYVHFSCSRWTLSLCVGSAVVTARCAWVLLYLLQTLTPTLTTITGTKSPETESQPSRSMMPIGCNTRAKPKEVGNNRKGWEAFQFLLRRRPARFHLR
jgi:hypothetical protein